MSRRKARVRPKRTSKETASAVCARVWAAADAHELQKLKDSVATAVKLLGEVQDDLAHVGSYVFVCLEALAAPVGRRTEDGHDDIALVLSDAYEKLHLCAEQNVQNALTALGKEGAA